MPDAPIDSSAMMFDPKVIAKFADCGVTFLDSPDDVIQLALAYLHLDPNSQRPEDLKAAEQIVMSVRPYIRQFDSNDYWHQFASNETCLAIAWSSDYSVAQLRAREDGTGAHLAFTLPKEGSNITYNAFLIPASAPHPDAAHEFLNFILDPKVIAEITNDIDYGNDNLARGRMSARISWMIRRCIRRPRFGRGCTCPPNSAPTTTGCAPGCGPASRPDNNQRFADLRPERRAGPELRPRPGPGPRTVNTVIFALPGAFCDVAQLSPRAGNGSLRPHYRYQRLAAVGAAFSQSQGAFSRC